MKKIVEKGFLVLLAVALLPVLSTAQVRGGDIYGAVVLTDGSRVPGVLLTLNGDKIGKLTTISSEKGNFRFLALPPGLYEVKCELEGFKTVIRKDIDVSLGKSVTLNILMETTPLKEEVLVSERVGLIDTRKTNVGVNISREMIESVPTARNPWTVLSSLPGVMVDRVDIGGADSGQQSNFLAGGADQDDTTWNIDGANLTDPSAIGAAPAYLNINSYGELQVTLGANDISAQTGGIQLNFVTKRAGNKTSGDFHLYVEDKAWEMKQTPTDYMVQRDWVIPGVDRLYMYGVNLGGPIVKDKLWWFGSWAIQDIHKRTEPGIEDATWLVSGYGKLNFQLGNTSGDFHLSYDAKLKWGRAFLSPAQQDNGSLWDQVGPGYLFYGGLSHVFGELMLNVKSVYTDGGFALDPRGADVNPATGHNEGAETLFVDGGAQLLGSFYDYSTNRNSIDISMDGNYFLESTLGGDHEIRFGVDYFTADTTTHTLFANQRIVYTYTETPQFNHLGIYPDYILDVGFKRISAFIQDTVTWGKLTVSFGLRYDREQGNVNANTQPGFTWYEPGSPHHGEEIFASEIQDLSYPDYKIPANWSLLSPRIAFTYDIGGDSKTVLKLSAGRYMSQSGNTMASALIPGRYCYSEWTDVNHDNIPQYEELGELYSTNLLHLYDPATGLNKVQFDPGYNTPYLDELTLVFERALTDDMAVSVTGFYKKRSNLSADVDSRGEIANVTKGILPDGSIETKANWEYIGTTRVGGTDVPTYEQIVPKDGDYYYNLDKAYDKYLGIQFLLNKKLAKNWMAQLSFTYQDWKHHRFVEETFDLNNFDFFNGAIVAPATTGSGLRDIWVNSRWMVKLTGMYQLPWGLNFTGFFQAREGNPQPLRRRVSGFTQGAEYFYRLGYKAGDERLPTLWLLNLGLEKTLKITDTVTATLVVDWYNATNNQIELKHNLEIGLEAPDDTRPVQWTNAGLFQFGVRVNF